MLTIFGNAFSSMSSRASRMWGDGSPLEDVSTTPRAEDVDVPWLEFSSSLSLIILALLAWNE